MSVIVVAGGTREEAARWAASERLAPDKVQLVTSVRSVEGLRASAAVLVGRFWHRSDAAQLYDAIQIVLLKDRASLQLRDLTRTDG